MTRAPAPPFRVIWAASRCTALARSALSKMSPPPQEGARQFLSFIDDAGTWVHECHKVRKSRVLLMKQAGKTEDAGKVLDVLIAAEGLNETILQAPELVLSDIGAEPIALEFSRRRVDLDGRSQRIGPLKTVIVILEDGANADDVIVFPSSPIRFVDGDEDARTSFIQGDKLVPMLIERAMKDTCEPGVFSLLVVIKALKTKKLCMRVEELKKSPPLRPEREQAKCRAPGRSWSRSPI